MAMKRWCALIAMIVFVPRVSAAEEPVPKDQDKLRGRWNVVATQFDGQPMSAEAIKNREIEFEDGKFKVWIGGALRRTLKFTLESTKQPKQIDIINPDKNEMSRGIYVFDKDELKLCYGEPGEARPT